MSTKRLLVVATAPVDEALLRDRLQERPGPDAEIRVVAPASDLSPLEWLATDEDEAAKRPPRSHAPRPARVDAEIGDSDPVQAIEDALRQFPAE